MKELKFASPLRTASILIILAICFVILSWAQDVIIVPLWFAVIFSSMLFPICFQLEKWGCGIWQDKTFIAEWDRRTAEYEKGKAKTLTLDQLEAKAQRFLAIVRRKIEEIAMAPHNYGTRSRKGALVLDIVDRGRTNILT